MHRAPMGGGVRHSPACATVSGSFSSFAGDGALPSAPDGGWQTTDDTAAWWTDGQLGGNGGRAPSVEK